MNKMWIIFKHEYARHVLRARFIWALLSVPLIMALSGGIGFLGAMTSIDRRPIGVVDQSGLNLEITPELSQIELPFGSPQFTLIPEAASAEQQLTSEALQGYYLVPADYLVTGNVEYHTLNPNAYSTTEEFSAILTHNLLRDQPPEVSNRLTSNLRINTLNLETGQPFDLLGFLIPLVSGLFLIIAINITSGYLLQAMTEEKENHTMEIVITSVSPRQLLVGKMLAIVCVGLTQMIVWMVALLLAVKLFAAPLLQTSSISIDPLLILVEVLTFLFTFITISALMVLIGTSATEASEAQGVASIVSMILFVPVWLSFFLISNPNSAVSVFMSLFPLTAPIAMPTRMALVGVPKYEIVACLILGILFAIGAIWLSVKAFHKGMLRYGKKLTIKEIFAGSR